MHDDRFGREFAAAASVFVFAGFIGTWMRFAQVTGGFGPLHFPDVRHAHSHLMLFSWAIPGILICLAGRFGPSDAAVFRRVIRAAMGLGLLSFIPFFHWGYRPVQIAGLRLPLSIVISTGVLFVWYGAIAVYWRRRHGLADHERAMWDIVMASLALCSVGAWMRGIFTAVKMGATVWAAASVQGFLTILTDGVLFFGILAAASHGSHARPPRMARAMVVGGLPLTFLAYVQAAPSLRVVGILSSILFLVGAGWVVWSTPSIAVRSRWAAGLIILARLAYMVPPVNDILGGPGFRVLALHWIFLAVVSMGLLEHRRLPARQLNAFAAAVALLIIGILPTTDVWPAAYRTAGLWFCVGTSALPAVVMLGLLWLPSLRPLRRV